VEEAPEVVEQVEVETKEGEGGGGAKEEKSEIKDELKEDKNVGEA